MIRELDENGDILAGSFLYYDEEIAQNVIYQCKLIINENAYNLDDGIDWPNELSIGRKERIKILLRDRILSVRGVTGLTEDLEITNIENRKFQAKFQIITINSNIIPVDMVK